MTSIVIAIGLALYLLLYFTYGKKVERDVVQASDDTLVPSKRLNDGVDFIPARKEVLFGHHFASIAGAAPIIGPAVAIVWGWLPGLLWVWFGNIFIGAIHDYLALMASVRYDGKSIQFVASDLIGHRTGRSFYAIVFVLLILVVAAFAAIIGGIFTNSGETASAYIFKIVAALILGVLMYRTKLGFGLSSLIGVLMLVGAIWLGTVFPVVASYDVWMAVFFFYIIIAASIPVNVLLQPRDYLNSYLLYAGLLIGLVAALFAVRSFEIPMFSSFAPVLMAGKATPFWPAIPLIIACGALSGFHSLVASGTTSKQIESERDGLPIGMGGMLLEGFLSTVVVVSIAGFGYTAIRNAGATLNVPINLTMDNWGETFTSTTGAVKLAKANLFVQSYSDMVGATWLAFLPAAIVKVVAGMWVASFAMTTLDTTNRLGRYCLVELLSPIKDSAPGVHQVVTNRWVASTIPALIGIYLAWSGQWLVIWGAFGAANQIIASVALLTASVYVSKKLHSRFANIVFVPAILLWITVFAAMLWMLVVVMPVSIAANPVPGWTVAVLVGIMVVLNLVFIFDFYKAYFGGEKVPPGRPAHV